ncbi:MAG: hypothetical protein QHJ73_04605, partial [Armatimonadota bacterium]|nr:hypothetical protein [Armatimonadota bacterium]
LRSARIDGAGAAAGVPDSGPIPIRLQFAHPVRNLRNERKGSDLGSGTRFEDEWVPYEANVYSFDRLEGPALPLRERNT